MLGKQQVLQGAVAALNNDDNPWEVSVDGDSIVAKWKWMDARFFGVGEVTDETKAFVYTVTLDDKGRYREKDSSQESKVNVDLAGGKVSFGKSMFSGASAGKSFTIGIGQNKDTGETGVVKFKFDTKLVKEPVREYLKNCGWKKAGLFSR